MSNRHTTLTFASDFDDLYSSYANRNEPSPDDAYADFQAILSALNDLADSFTLSPALGRMSTLDSFLDLSPGPSNRTSLVALSELSDSSSDTACHESDCGLESDTETDVDEDEYDETKGDGMYSYRLLPALTVPSIAPGPSSMHAPWPYTFEKGSTAFAKSSNGKWRRVTLLDSGFLSSLGDDESDIPGSRALVYTGQWADSSGMLCRATFCPMRGDLKPDDAHVRRLLAKHGVLNQV